MDFERCSDITDAIIFEAISSPKALAALLDRASAVAEPGEGAPKVLLAIARLPQSNWLRGQLVVEIDGTDRETWLTLATELRGKRTNIIPPTTLRVPLDEFTRAVRIAPRLVEPLEIVQREPRVLLLGPAVARPSSRPTRQQMIAVPPEAKRTNPRVPAVSRDVHEKKTITNMEAVRLADRPEARRDDQADIDEAWGDDEK